MPKPVLPTKRRRKGFESVRKGYCSADARLWFFEKELFYCKLTVASSIRKGLLHVSFGAVRNYCRGMLKNAFLYRAALHEPKKRLYRESKKFSLAETLRTSLKAAFLRTKTSFCTCLSSLSAKTSIFTNQKFFFRTNLFYCHPKQLFFALRCPFQRPLTYCLQRMQLFFCCLRELLVL